MSQINLVSKDARLGDNPVKYVRKGLPKNGNARASRVAGNILFLDVNGSIRVFIL